MNKPCNRLLIYLTFGFLLLSGSLATGQPVQAGQPLVIDSALRKHLIDTLISVLQAQYILPEKNKEIAAYMQAKLKSGAYDKIDNARQLASALTQDLRTAGKDLHLFLDYNPALEQALLRTHLGPSYELQELPLSEERLMELRQSNYDFRKLEILQGNVGYLDLRSFVDINYAKETAVAAMAFLANTDAIIIDVRKNPGGFINSENFLASYFYGVDPVELLSRYHREGNVTVREWTLRDLPGKRLPYVDLYILTSRETGSAGEGFSFILQQRKRAKIVGEKTSGAGYGNKESAVGNGFVFFVSVLRPFDPRTGRGWQDVGVEPDIAVPADQALRVAHTEAVKNLATKVTDQRRKQQFSWLAPLLALDAYGAKPIDTSVLESYTGKYDGGKIVVSLEQGQLYFLGASGVRRKLIALNDDSFLVEDTTVPAENQARVRFIKNTNGIVTELNLLVADGRSFPRTKD